MTTADRIAVMDQGLIQQVGSALEIFDQPANRFVANFVGSVNLVPGDFLQLATATVDVVIRPHTIAIARSPGGAQRRWVAGTVADREFLGAFIRYKVKTAPGELVVEVPHSIGAGGHVPGDAVYLGIDPAQVRLINSPAGGAP